MARPLRVDVKWGWYHISARGIERRRIFHGSRYYQHFIELLEEMSSRYAVEVHAYCLMGNHYHLIIRTPEANASKAMQWLNVSYSAWFNAKQDRVGHVFQGRFSSVLIDNDGSWLLMASEYLHLNPVRTAGMGLGKRDNRAEGRGFREACGEEVGKRFEEIRKFKWSSYPAYAGYSGKPKWLHTEVILARSGGKTRYRKAVQEHITRGADPESFECLRGSVAIGGAKFVQRAKSLVGKVTREQPDRSFVRRLVDFGQIVDIVEEETGQRWEDFGKRRGDRIRNLVLWLARHRSGMTLKEIGEKAGGLDYKMVGKAVKRCEEQMKENRGLRKLGKQLVAQMATFETPLPLMDRTPLLKGKRREKRGASLRR
jgi:REP element-mobilizing transposase RayT